MSIALSTLKSKFKASKRDWDQWCQAGVVNAAEWSGGFVQTYASAIDAYHASHIESTDASKAPVNAVHYWSIGKYGHVAGGLGGENVWMCSTHVQTKWGINVGQTTVSAYSKATGAKYLGWSKTNGKNTLHITMPAPAKKPTPAAPSFHYMEPSHAVQVRVQRALGHRKRYYGPADGKFGTNTRKGIQKTLVTSMGYKGKVDGNLNTATQCQLIQQFAKKYGGYAGPVDKKLGENSWIGFAVALERHG